MAEELRLEATVVDKFSKPLRDLRSRLNDVKPPEHIGKMAAEFQRVENAVKGVSGSITKNLGTAMAGLSIPSLAAVASIGGLVAAVKGFSTATIELRQFQRETGITIGAFKTLKHAASQFGINEDTIGPGLKKFSDNLFDFRRRYGQTYSELVQIAPDFVKKLRQSAPDKALDDSLRYIEQVARERGPRVAGILADKLFGSDQFARFGLKGIKPLQDALKAVKSSSDISKADEDIAVRFAQSVEKLQEAFGKVSKTVGNELAPAFVSVMESTNKFLEANQGKIGTAVKDALDGITASAKNFDWRAFGQDLTTIGHALARVAKHFDGRTGQRQATGGAIGEIQDNLAKARKRLQDYDKAHPHAAGNDPARQKLAGDVQFFEDRLAKATARGVELGMDRFFQRQSFSGRGAGGSGGGPGGSGGLIEASFGGGGYVGGGGGIRRSFGGGDEESEHPHSGRQIRERFHPPSATHDKGSDRGLGRARQGFMRRATKGGPGFGPSAHASRRGGPSVISQEASLTPEARALLDTIASSEANPGGGYNSRFPSKTFNNGFVDHPRIRERITRGPNAGRTSDAAGRYQFLSRTWDHFRRQLNLKDFSPGSQDRAAWQDAREVYKRNTGRDLQGDLGSHDPATIARVGRALHGEWTSLPGGIEQGQGASLMVQRFNRNLARQNSKVHRLEGKDGKGAAGSLGGKGNAGRDRSSRLDVHFHNPPGKMRTNANGGHLFHEIRVARGRSMIPASESA